MLPLHCHVADCCLLAGSLCAREGPGELAMREQPCLWLSCRTQLSSRLIICVNAACEVALLISAGNQATHLHLMPLHGYVSSAEEQDIAVRVTGGMIPCQLC